MVKDRMSKKIILFLLFQLILSFPFNSFGDIIDDMLNQAIQNDFKLQSLRHQEKAKKYQIEQSKSQYKPHVSFSSYLGWQEYKPYYGGTQKQTLKYFYLALKQPIYHPEILSQIKLSKLYRDIAKLKVEQEKQYIRYYFFNVLFDYLYAKQKLELHRKIKDLSKKRLIYINKLYQFKRATKEDLNLAESNYQDAYISFKESEAEFNNYKKALFLLANWNNAFSDNKKLDKKLKMNTNFNIKTLLKEYNWWLSKLDNNFEVREAKKNIEIAKKEIKKRSHQRYPKVDLELSYRYASTSAVSVASEDKRIALIIDFPFYQGGYISNLVLEAKELEKSALMDLKNIRKEKEFNLQNNFYSMKQATDKLTALRKQLNILYKLLKDTEKGKDMKVKTDLDIIDVKLKILRTKLALTEEFHTFCVSYVKLLYITGMLNEENTKELKTLIDYEN